MPKVCERCNRPVLFPALEKYGVEKHVLKVIIRHTSYGCDSGCCGHEIVGLDCNGEEVFTEFDFVHPFNADWSGWATSLADHYFPGAQLDLGHCQIVDD